MEKITQLEKEVLRQGIDYGFIFDDKDSDFLCWGFTGARERGAVASLVKKGILTTYKTDDDTYIWINIDRKEFFKLAEVKDIANED